MQHINTKHLTLTDKYNGGGVMYEVCPTAMGPSYLAVIEATKIFP